MSLNGRPEKDHPRVSGEHATTAAPAPLTAGSSPRERGARGCENGCQFVRGIIPA